MQKTSMSVNEMRRMLGIGKTESYWLVKKQQFEVRNVCGTFRVMIHSFEDWYDHQTHYKKVNGDPPGSKLEKTFSVNELAKLLNISLSSANALAVKGYFRTIREGQYQRIVKDSFEEWYASQFRYKKANGEEPGTKYPKSISARELAEMLGIPLRNTAYELIQRGQFNSFIAQGQLRVEIESFEKWYSNQTKYRKVKEVT